MLDKLNNFYNAYNEGERLLSSRARRIEYLTTLASLEKYLGGNCSAIELGSGFGIYVDYLKDKVSEVTGSDIVDKHVDEMKKRFESYENVKVLKLDARNMNEISDEKYDIVLCFGPYYHINDFIQRMELIRECKRICRKNGIIAFAYINKFYANAMYIKNGIYFDQVEYDKFSKGEYKELDYKDAFMGISHFCSPDEIEEEVGQNNLKILDNVGVDGVYSLFSEKIDEMDENEYKSLIEYHIKNSKNQSILGMSSHGMVIVRKET